MKRRCRDGGYCHHDCGKACWREANAAPLSRFADWGAVPERREAEFYIASADRGRRWDDKREPDWDEVRDRRDDV